MRIGLQTWGSEGDVRPFFALAQGLQRRGHTVQVVYTNVEGRDYGPLAERCGVRARPAAGEYFALNRDAIQRSARASFDDANPARQFDAIFRDLLDPVLEPMLAASLELARESDLVLAHPLAFPSALAAQSLGVPLGLVALQPMVPSAHYAPPGAPSLSGPLGRLVNRGLWAVASWLMGRSLRDRINRVGATLGLAPLARFDPATVGGAKTMLVAVSPALFARPPDWGPNLAVTGFLRLDERASAWEPDPDLARFLDAGAPVFLSFGSLFSADPDRTLVDVKIFVDALRRAGLRGVIQCPPATQAAAPREAHVCYLTAAPHAKLFPRCSVIVHHAGAGTTQSALLARRPSVVVPHLADQFYWGELLRAQGVAPKPLLHRDLTADRLARRLREAHDDRAMAANARRLGDALDAEDGTTAAVDALLGTFGPGA